MSDYLQQISTAVIEGNLDDIADLTQDALDEGLTAEEILNKGLMPGMDHVGVEFRAGNMFVPEVLRSAKTMQIAMDTLKPLLAEAGVKAAGKVLLGTVKGDLHDIGKNLVSMMLEGAGFEILDLGTDVAPEKIVAEVKEFSPDIVALSALLTTTMPNMKATIEALKAAGLRDKVKVIIGGAPVTEAYAHQIGADGFSPNAARAVIVAKDLIRKS